MEIKNTELMHELLLNNKDIHSVCPIEGSQPAYWGYLVTVDNRDHVMSELKAAGIRVSSLHQRNDLYSCFDVKELEKGSNTEKLQNSIIALPCGWWLSERNIKKIIAVLTRITSTD